MSVAELSSLEFIGTLIAALLTVMVLSYLIGDNLLFRLATYLFIGVASGYAGSIAFHNVLSPGLIEPFFSRNLGEIFAPTSIVTLIVPWILVLLLILKVSPATARFGGLPVAIMVGVGAAVIVGGGITGTLIPQSLASMDSLDPGAQAPLTGEQGIERIINVVIMLLGTISTLVYFRFSARRQPSGEPSRSRISQVLAFIGRMFIAVTFGVMYAGALAATVVVLAERMEFLQRVLSLFLVGT
jgi:hypothetical protein